MSKHKVNYVNENFFRYPERWEEKESYWLGWLLSDGCLNYQTGSLRIRLQEKDKEILEKLKTLIDYTGNLCYEKRNNASLGLAEKSRQKVQNRYGLCIRNKNLTNSIQALGILQTKSSRVSFPTFLQEKNIVHFLRGYYDGDGTLSYHRGKSGGIKVDIRFLGFLDFLTKINVKLKDHHIHSLITSRPNIKTPMYDCSIHGGFNAILFFNYLYKNANFYLERKARKFLHIYNHFKKNIYLQSRHDNFAEQFNIAKNILEKIYLK